jgi:hypothetical protein
MLGLDEHGTLQSGMRENKKEKRVISRLQTNQSIKINRRNKMIAVEMHAAAVTKKM